MGTSVLIIGMGLLLLAGVFFVFLILPIWLLINCVTSDSSKASKAVWVVCMFLLYPWAGYAYGLFAAKRPVLRIFCGLALGGIVLIIAGLAFYLGADVRRADNVASACALKIEQGPAEALPAPEKERIVSSLLVLKKELDLPWHRTESKYKAIILIDNFDQMISDGNLTQEELRDWDNKFQARETLDPSALRQAIRQL